jgi:pimeloyl-ACP methyl ester carboxylesterase
VPPDLVLDYVHGAVQKVLETSGAEEISLFGQSQGGTLCAMYASLFPQGLLKYLILLSAPTEFAPRNPGALGLWTLASRSSGAYFDPAMVPKIFANLPTGLASQIINSMSSLQATAVGTAARPFGRGFGVYDAALGAMRDLAEQDVSMRSWLAVSKWVDDAAPFPGEVFRRWVTDFYQRDRLVKGRSSCAGGGWISRTSSARCSTSRASATTSCRAPRPRPRPPTLAVWTRSQCLWTPDTWACSSGRGPRIYGPAFGTGSRLALGILQPPDTSIRRHSD